MSKQEFRNLGTVAGLGSVVLAVTKAHKAKDYTPIGYTLGKRNMLVLPAATYATEGSVKANSVSRGVAQRMNPGMGKHMVHAMKFLSGYAADGQWTSYGKDRSTVDAIKALVRKGLVEVNEFRQFRIKGKAERKSNPSAAGSASIRPLPKNPHHPDYSTRVKLRGYNGPVTVTSAHGADAGKVLRKLHPEATKEEHKSIARKYQKRADALKREYFKLLDKAAMETWGRKWQTTDYQVSGIGSSAFSAKMKDKLRRSNSEFNLYEKASHAHQAAAGKRYPGRG